MGQLSKRFAVHFILAPHHGGETNGRAGRGNDERDQAQRIGQVDGIEHWRLRGNRVPDAGQVRSHGAVAQRCTVYVTAV